MRQLSPPLRHPPDSEVGFFFFFFSPWLEHVLKAAESSQTAPEHWCVCVCGGGVDDDVHHITAAHMRLCLQDVRACTWGSCDMRPHPWAHLGPSLRSLLFFFFFLLLACETRRRTRAHEHKAAVLPRFSPRRGSTPEHVLKAHHYLTLFVTHSGIRRRFHTNTFTKHCFASHWGMAELVSQRRKDGRRADKQKARAQT